jgi:hypothetical protein
VFGERRHGEQAPQELEPARLARCLVFRRPVFFLNLQRALSLGAGNWSSSSLATFAALSAHLAGERQPKTGAQPGAPNNRTVERERRLLRRQESKVGMHIDHVGQS